MENMKAIRPAQSIGRCSFTITYRSPSDFQTILEKHGNKPSIILMGTHSKLLTSASVHSSHPYGDEFALGTSLTTASKHDDFYTLFLPREVTAEEVKYLNSKRGWTDDEINDKRKNIVLSDISDYLYEIQSNLQVTGPETFT